MSFKTKYNLKLLRKHTDRFQFGGDELTNRENALAITNQAPDEFAYNLMKGPEYMAVTAGEVVRVIKCIPVEVTVLHGEETPRTHIIKTRGTQITCNSILPLYYLIEGNWYKLLPKPTEGIEPITNLPSTRQTWEYTNPASLATSGIYTEKEQGSGRNSQRLEQLAPES